MYIDIFPYRNATGICKQIFEKKYKENCEKKAQDIGRLLYIKLIITMYNHFINLITYLVHLIPFINRFIKFHKISQNN